MAKADPDTDASPPSMSFSELMMLTLKFNDRLDYLWQRVIYTHAALVGVMVFFGRSAEPFILQRGLVFFIYTCSALITYVSIRDTYRGYRSALEDLAALKEQDETSNVQAWVKSQNITNQPRRYGAIFIMIWAVLGYLLLGGVFRQL